MRVLIVAANQEHKPDPVVPLGAAWVAAAAEHAGHHVRLFDACFLGEQSTPLLRREVECCDPDVVGISLRNIDDVAWPRAHSYLDDYRRVVAAVREAAPSALVVLGGSAFTLMPELFLRELGADCGVAGEGESAFIGLLGEFRRRGVASLRGRVLQGKGTIPGLRPALHLLDIGQYYRRGGALNVQTRRGCAFQCTYCTYPLLEGRESRLQEVAPVVDEMLRAERDHGARHFFIVDNTFNQPAAHAHAFCEELLRRGADVHWTAYVSPRGLTPELLALMARAGCSSIEFGTDAASPDTLKALGKSFGVTEILLASAWCRDAGIRFAHSLILGGPDESRESMHETVRVIESTGATAVFGMLGVRLYPGTALARRAEREGLIAEADLGLEPVFYISDAVRDELEPFARTLKARHANWYFPGLEGERWVRYWRRRRQHGARGPLWEWMGQPEVLHEAGN